MRSIQLQEKPIPQSIRICGCSIQIDYYGQPTRRYLCKQFGHMTSDCPEAVKTPPTYVFDKDFNVAKVSTPSDEQEARLLASNASTPITHEPQYPQGISDKTPERTEPTTSQNMPEDQQSNEREDLQQTSKGPENCDSEFSSSSSEAGETPEQSIFMTDEETDETGHKRQHSPDAETEKKQKPHATGEIYECECGCSVTLPDRGVASMNARHALLSVDKT